MESKKCEACGTDILEGLNHECNMTEEQNTEVIDTIDETTNVEDINESKSSFKHPSLDNKSSNSRYVLTFEDFMKNKVKTQHGQDKAYSDARIKTVATDKTGTSKKPLDDNQK